jgi:hypothetical protein
MKPDPSPSDTHATAIANSHSRLKHPFTLMAVSVSIGIWVILFFLSYFLLWQSALIWLLGQNVLPGKFAVWLASVGFLGLGQLLPPGITVALGWKYGTKGILPLFVLSLAIVPITLTYGRIDTQGTIWRNFDRAVQQNNMDQARGLLLILTRRYAEYGYFTDGAALIRAGVDPNVQDSRGITALMSVLDNPTEVQQLIQRGADVRIKDHSGNTALDYAKSYPQTMQILQQADHRRKLP